MREVTDERSTRPPVYIGDFEHRESVQSDGLVTRDYLPPGIEPTRGRSADGLSRSDPELRDHLPYVSVRRVPDARTALPDRLRPSMSA